MYRILHLSDLHFGGSHHYRQSTGDPQSPTLTDAVLGAYRKKFRNEVLDCVILSGDLLSNDQSKDFHSAANHLQAFHRALGVDLTRILVVPGNHDLTWESEYTTQPYKFYDDLMQSCGLLNCKSAALPEIVELPPAPGVTKRLAVILLDSCQLEGSQEMAGLGRIGSMQLNTMESKLEERGVSSATHLLIAVLHHHLLPLTPENTIWDKNSPRTGKLVGRVSLTVDAVEVLRKLTLNGVSMVLHGHQHRPAVLHYQNMVLSPDKSLYVIAGGSCGAKQEAGETQRRHFFIHQITDDGAVVHSFRQLDENQAEFEPESSPVNLSFNPSSKSRIYSLPIRTTAITKLETTETLKSKDSDLHFLFLSVVDCPEARRVIRTTVTNLGESGVWPKRQGASFCLQSMYDLIGYWDLAVRFRADREADVEALVSFFDEQLTKEGMLESPADRNSSPFGMIRHVAVQRELAALAGYFSPAESVERQRVWLKTTDAYEEEGCQRGFVYITALPQKVAELIRNLRAELGRDGTVEAIIECVYVSPKEILLELFMRPTQAVLLTRLNRVIEPALKPCRSQKYTLLCYGYEEREVAVS